MYVKIGKQKKGQQELSLMSAITNEKKLNRLLYLRTQEGEDGRQD
jgi:hypothetical protein